MSVWMAKAISVKYSVVIVYFYRSNLRFLQCVDVCLDRAIVVFLCFCTTRCTSSLM